MTFQYASNYIDDPHAYEFAPSLPLALGPYPLEGLGAFSDAAPDRWGRKLERALQCTRLNEIDYLLGVNDLTRQGAYRFFSHEGPLTGSDGVPILTNLPALLTAADAIQRGFEISQTDLRHLYRATGSLGGAHPKASVQDRGTLWLAKFPKPQGDAWDVIGWESITLMLTSAVGISAPQQRTIDIRNLDGRKRTVLLSQRFDRIKHAGESNHQRIFYISAMTALEAPDGQGGDWLDLAEFTSSLGANTQELWLRAVFGSAIGNLDDHLRNHGFLHTNKGWQLAPAFDVNPTPYEYEGEGSDIHQLALLGNPSSSLADFCHADVLKLFRVTQSQATHALDTIGLTLAQATTQVRLHRLDTTSQEIMAGRLKHATE